MYVIYIHCNLRFYFFLKRGGHSLETFIGFQKSAFIAMFHLVLHCIANSTAYYDKALALMVILRSEPDGCLQCLLRCIAF